QAAHISSLRVFFKWLAQKGQFAWNPACELELPRVQRGLPAVVFTAQEAELVIAQPDPKTLDGLRDRAMLELLYATGMRRLELCLLNVYDIDRTRGLIHIRKGKGAKPRIVPLSERALRWIERYLDESRPKLLRDPTDEAIFVGVRTGKALNPGHLTHLVTKHIRAAELGKQGSCHAFRHTVATLMLENGADLRHVQELLGHANVQTTQIYTQVSLRKLKEVYERTHPSHVQAKEREERKAMKSKQDQARREVD
ncbi:MAG: tyrosine-type recombinase/integrase, partial [Myxococcales bacterium]|nr:tyrosine-type recombinase/integrase [Myxococcales bacterium]